ncbi:MAG: hypothetical protein A2X25_04970 [Chloroflexi bacterium GWB2_49_20]|nr:MAG: hypothetical protein A2X25_04970 [Chloroflexi bacterium GWB2_49_20]OGN80534.1 MAG: hypothetical protein A2X26_12080 [Chloroflexi bacterium GWC2_49_37]OGN83369.1 MAG: hypothetical protein A2X27_12255 [Chloroflexi bacterium GWD2_49_16]HCC78138.1 hypothetical protein [Anaerolineae bacterium]
MDEHYDFDDEFETASHGGGYYPGLWLPPLVVIFVGLLIGLITSGVVISQSVMAASNPGAALQAALQMDASSSSIPNDGNGLLAGLFTPEVLYWQRNIMEWSSITGLDPNLIATVMQIESCGDPQAKSSAGAMGLFQVMPFHFSSEDNPYEPETNAMRGMSYLRKSLEVSSGDARLAFAGYNGGISIIEKSEGSWAEETQRYAYWGSGIYEEASQGVEVSQRLQEWLSHGGASLCQQAASRLGINP